MWTIEYEADIESDLSAFHRVDDVMTLDGPRYFLLAIRLAAYSGVLAARAEKLRQDERDGVSAARGAAPATSSAAAPSHVEPDTLLATLRAEGWAEHTTEEEGA